MTNFDSAVLPGLTWASRLGASCLRPLGLPGTGLPAAACGTGPSTVAAHAVPRVRGKVAVVAPPQVSVATLLGQTNIHNYMTGAVTVGEGASGPPPYREPV
ncbi:MAG: hypothetical protein JO037_21695 [Actinobacteria bacterium]|nr:hypothetical protein [Actinomycetota bacterium]